MKERTLSVRAGHRPDITYEEAIVRASAILDQPPRQAFAQPMFQDMVAPHADFVVANLAVCKGSEHSPPRTAPRAAGCPRRADPQAGR